MNIGLDGGDFFGEVERLYSCIERIARAIERLSLHIERARTWIDQIARAQIT